MNKRFLLVLCILTCIIITTGCTGDSIFNDREEEVIADYMAQIVLKHSKGYVYKLEDVSNNPFIREEVDETEGTVEELLDKEINNSKEGETKEDTDKNEEEKKEEKEEITISNALGFDKNIKV